MVTKKQIFNGMKNPYNNTIDENLKSDKTPIIVLEKLCLNT